MTSDAAKSDFRFLVLYPQADLGSAAIAKRSATVHERNLLRSVAAQR